MYLWHLIQHDWIISLLCRKQNFNKQMEKLSRSNKEIQKAKEKVTDEFLEKIQQKNSKIHKLEVS